MIIGCDTGTKNWAYSKVIKTKKGNYRVIEASIFTNTIQTLTQSGFQDQRKAFTNDLQTILLNSNPKHIVTERFQTRGFGGPLIELVSTMGGVVAHASAVQGINHRLVTASEWKNHLKRRCGDVLPVLYSSYIPHLVDASMIALYHYEAFDWLNENYVSFIASLRQNAEILK